MQTHFGERHSAGGRASRSATDDKRSGASPGRTAVQPDEGSGAPVASPPRIIASHQRLGYRPALDGLRGIAVLCVLAINSLLSCFQGGYIGVDIFFVLSGFLITTLLAEEWEQTGKLNLRRFYLRRALRLLPALFLLLAVCIVYAALFQSDDMAARTYRESVWVVFYFANWMLAALHEVGSLDHAWSLSVEEQFYLLWPIVLWSLLKMRVRKDRVLLSIGALATASAVWRTFLWQLHAPFERLYYGSDTRADALLIGCLIGLAHTWHAPPARASARSFWDRANGPWPIRILATIALVFLAVIGRSVPYQSPFLYQGGLTLISLAAGLLVIGAVRFPDSWPARIFSIGLLVWLGRISYSLYLWHFPVFTALRAERLAALGWGAITTQSFRFAAVFVAACFSYYCVERPFLRLKNQFGPVIR